VKAPSWWASLKISDPPADAVIVQPYVGSVATRVARTDSAMVGLPIAVMTFAWSTRRSMLAPIGSTMRSAGPFFQPSVAIVTVPDGAAWTADRLLDADPEPDGAIAHPPSTKTRHVRPTTVRIDASLPLDKILEVAVHHGDTSTATSPRHLRPSCS